MKVVTVTIVRPVCGVRGCDRPQYAKHRCYMHYLREWKANRKAARGSTSRTASKKQEGNGSASTDSTS